MRTGAVHKILKFCEHRMCARHKAHLLTHPRVGGDHLVGEEVEVEPRLAEDVLAQLDDLERQHVLAAVVAHLEDGRLPHVLARRDLQMTMSY